VLAEPISQRCHCEEQSDEAISFFQKDEIATAFLTKSLAMTKILSLREAKRQSNLFYQRRNLNKIILNE
jgi:hypothetical protein